MVKNNTLKMIALCLKCTYKPLVFHVYSGFFCNYEISVNYSSSIIAHVIDKDYCVGGFIGANSVKRVASESKWMQR